MRSEPHYAKCHHQSAHYGQRERPGYIPCIIDSEDQAMVLYMCWLPIRRADRMLLVVVHRRPYRTVVDTSAFRRVKATLTSIQPIQKQECVLFIIVQGVDFYPFLLQNNNVRMRFGFFFRPFCLATHFSCVIPKIVNGGDFLLE